MTHSVFMVSVWVAVSDREMVALDSAWDNFSSRKLICKTNMNKQTWIQGWYGKVMGKERNMT